MDSLALVKGIISVAGTTNSGVLMVILRSTFTNCLRRITLLKSPSMNSIAEVPKDTVPVKNNGCILTGDHMDVLQRLACVQVVDPEYSVKLEEVIIFYLIF